MVAIIMATYQGEAFLEEQLSSICQNTRKDWKLYLFDDGSTDGTVSLAERYAKEYPGQIVIKRNEKNLKSARNFYSGAQWVFREEPADYYMFCDQDDRWDLDKIEVTLKRMKKLEKRYGKELPLLVYTDSRMTDQDGRTLHPSFQATMHLDSRKCDFAHLLMENKMPGCTQMMNHKLLSVAFSHPGIPKYCKMHDWWFGLIAACFGKIGYVNQTTMDYRQHENNVVGGQSFAAYVTRRISRLREAREGLLADIRQGREFYQWYGNQMEEEERQTAKAFAALASADFVRKRVVLIRCHFWKSGLVRNVALFLLL